MSRRARGKGRPGTQRTKRDQRSGGFRSGRGGKRLVLTARHRGAGNGRGAARAPTAEEEAAAASGPETVHSRAQRAAAAGRAYSLCRPPAAEGARKAETRPAHGGA